jgi:AmmeMemoRadiSam system protein B
MRQMTSRKPQNAGEFYPKAAGELKSTIQKLLTENPVNGLRDVKAIVVPQGRYSDCGSLYAKAYNAVKGKKFEVVIIISSTAAEFFNYLSIFSGDEYDSPLGSAKLDTLMRDELADEDDDIYVSEKGHASNDPFIEVQIPWLHSVLEPGFKIVPLVMGNQTAELCQELDKALSEVLTQRSALVVIASELVYAGKTPASISKLNTEIVQNIDERNWDNFFNRKWRDQLQFASVGPLFVGRQVGWNLGCKTMTLLGQQQVAEKRESGDVSVTYFSMAFGR